MKPLALRLVNVGLYPELDLDFQHGVTAIVGLNGSGKSTLLDAVEVCLFAGVSSKDAAPQPARDLAPMLGPHGEAMEILLVFEHGGQRWRIRRRYRRGANGSGTAWLDLERHVFAGADGPSDAPGGWNTETRETARATQARICEVLGLSRATFRASAFLGQGAGTVFLDALPSERKALIGAILDPAGLWPKLLDRGRGEAREAESTLNVHSAQIAERQERLAELPHVNGLVALREAEETRHRHGLTVAEQELEHAQAALHANVAKAERVRTLTVQRDHARQAASEAQERLDQAKRAEADLPAAEAAVAELRDSAVLVPALEHQADAYRQAAAARHAAIAERAEYQRRADGAHRRRVENEADRARRAAEIAALRGAPEKVCPVCTSMLTDETRQEAMLESLTGQLAVIDEVIARIAAEEQEAKREAEAVVIPDVPAFDPVPLAQARAAAAKLPAAEHHAQTLAEQAAQTSKLEALRIDADLALSSASDLLAAAAEGVADELTLRQAVEDARATLTARRTALDATTADLVRARQQLEQLRQAEQELEALVNQSETLNGRLDLLRLAERAYGRDGVPALIVESIVPQLEADANQFLEQLAPPHLRVELHTQRALKTADHLRDTLEIVVFKNGEWTPRPSGGEKTRAGLGLAWALAGLLRQRFGGVEMLALDEPDALDAGGMDRLAEILRGLGDSFEVVLIVSHNPLLSTAFDNVLTVAETDGVSRIAQPSAVVVPA